MVLKQKIKIYKAIKVFAFIVLHFYLLVSSKESDSEQMFAIFASCITQAHTNPTLQMQNALQWPVT